MNDVERYIAQIDDLARRKKRYKSGAYHFIVEALEYTVKKTGERRHVSGAELCWGIKDYALEQFGPLAQTVFQHWGITETFDFGAIVYALIDEQLMKKTDEDSIEDFRGVYDLAEVFKPESYDFLASMGDEA